MAGTTGTGKYEQLLERCRSLAPVRDRRRASLREVSPGWSNRGRRERAHRRRCWSAPPPRFGRSRRKAASRSGSTPIVDVPHSHAAAAKAVELVRTGQAELLMKGSLHTDELLGAVVARETGLRTGRRISHVFIMDVPTYHKVLIVTDAAINIAPALEDKADICQNAIDLAVTLGVKTPKVAILAAVETVNSKMVATIDAAALCKMADRGQIKGGLLDGPLAFDNAISRDAARIKGIVSEVAGDPDILLVPDLESGNMLAKQLIVPRQRRQRRTGARRARADHPHEPGRQRAVANRELRRRHDGRACAAGDAADDGINQSEAGMDDYTVVVNAGSSSLKFCIYRRPEAAEWRLEARGQIEGIGTSPRFSAKDGCGRAACRRQPRQGGGARWSLGTGRAWRLAPLDVHGRPRPRRRSPRRSRRSALCRTDGRHAAGARRASRADTARAAPSATQSGGD